MPVQLLSFPQKFRGENSPKNIGNHHHGNPMSCYFSKSNCYLTWRVCVYIYIYICCLREYDVIFFLFSTHSQKFSSRATCAFEADRLLPCVTRSREDDRGDLKIFGERKSRQQEIARQQWEAAFFSSVSSKKKSFFRQKYHFTRFFDLQLSPGQDISSSMKFDPLASQPSGWTLCWRHNGSWNQQWKAGSWRQVVA